MFKFLVGLIVGCVLCYGYFYFNPKTFDVMIINNSPEAISRLDLTYTNSICPNSCTLTLSGIPLHGEQTLSFQNPGSGDYTVKVTFPDNSSLQSDHRSIQKAGHQSESVTRDSIDLRH